MSLASKFILKNLDSPLSSSLLVGTAYLSERIKAIQEKYVGDDKKLKVLSELSRTHLLHIYSEYKQTTPIVNEYTKLQSRSGKVSWGSEAIFDLPDVGHFWSDMVLNIGIDAVGDPNGNQFNGSPLYRYCEYPGIRAVEKTSLTIDGNPIDSYTSDDAMFIHDFEVPIDKKPSVEACIGHDQPKIGYIKNDDNMLRERKMILTGAQTSKVYQPAQDWWIRTNFWFNNGIENALCSGLVPFGQRFVQFKIADVAKIIKKTDINDNELTMNFNEIPAITKCTLYVNNILIDPQVYDLFLEKATFVVARVFNSMSSSLTTPNGRVWINKFKFPTEHVYFGFRPLSNTKSFDHWHKFVNLTEQSMQTPVVLYKGNTIPELAHKSIYFWDETQVVNTLTITVGSGHKIYENMHPRFFSCYLPSKCSAIVSPSDIGKCFLPFNQKPLRKEITGYIDLSKIRDFYLEYTSDVISTNNEVELILSSRSINFIVISKTMALKFAA